MSCGRGGKILRVDLSTGKISSEPIDPLAARWVGGRAINTWLLLAELDRETYWKDPENILAFGAGALVGTLAPGACRVSVDTKSAFTGGIGSANVGGFWGAELKFAGYDHLIIKGRASSPVYLRVDGDSVEIRDAHHLWGTTTWDAERRIRDELQDQRIRVAVIGPAGERLVRSACIICDRGCAAGGSGCGAVMGSKNLKAIAVRGRQSLHLARPETFMDAVSATLQKINRYPGMAELRRKGFYGSMGGQLDSPKWEQGYRKVRNGQDDYWGKEKIALVAEEVLGRYRRATVSCFSCPVSCKPWMQVDQGEYAVQGEGWWMNSAIAFCTTVDNTNPESALYAHNLCNQLGLDMDNAIQAIAWAFECFQRGLLDKNQTGGLELRWGDHRAVISMLEKLAFREGIGDLLADGALRAAAKLGKDSSKFAVHLKGQDSLDGIRINKAWGFAVVLSPVGGRHLRGGVTGFWKSDQPINSYQGVPEGVFLNQKQKAVQDILGTCSYVYGQSLEDWAAMTAGALGREFREEDLLQLGLQAHNLEKAFNTIHAGFTRRDDYPPHRYYHEAVRSGPYQGEHLDHEIWERMLDEYYELQNWDPQSGLQTREGLEGIGLADVADRIEATVGFDLES